jgi:hypothetical protein
MSKNKKHLRAASAEYLTAGRWEEMDWDTFYNELNAEGRLFVDYFAIQFERSIKYGIRRNYGLGEISARELALSMLCHYWNGELPELFPVLVELEMGENVRSAECVEVTR